MDVLSLLTVVVVIAQLMAWPSLPGLYLDYVTYLNKLFSLSVPLTPHLKKSLMIPIL
jgi:hypothetical protein